VHEDGETPTTSVFDAVTGELRFEPIRGSGKPVGPDGELLLFSERGQSPRVVRTRDGAQLEHWQSSSRAGGRLSTTGNESAPLESPQGRFEIRQDSKGDGEPTYRIINRHDRALIATSRKDKFRFSADDRWLAVWDGEPTVYDLSKGEAIFRFREAVDEMSFAGQGILHVRFVKNTSSMLIPLDWPVMERLLRWLTSRQLTPAEECQFGLRGQQCWSELPVQSPKAAH
jgi:hypothetical protein